MENAAKALIIASGVLLAMLLLSLFVYVWTTFSEYQQSKAELIQIEDTSKFNLQFSGYDRDDVLGYELLSLVNKVVDYNEKQTEQSQYGSNEGYMPISITINMGSEEYRKKLTYNDVLHLFLSNVGSGSKAECIYTDNELTAINNGERVHSFKTQIEEKIESICGELGAKNDDLTLLAKNIGTIFMNDDEIKARAERLFPGDSSGVQWVKQDMIDQFRRYTDLDIDSVDYLRLTANKEKTIKSLSSNSFKDYYQMTCAYYEYMQFKRAIFECTNLAYDDVTGRVNRIEFNFTGRLH